MSNKWSKNEPIQMKLENWHHLWISIKHKENGIVHLIETKTVAVSADFHHYLKEMYTFGWFVLGRWDIKKKVIKLVCTECENVGFMKIWLFWCKLLQSEQEREEQSNYNMQRVSDTLKLAVGIFTLEDWKMCVHKLKKVCSN